MASGNTNVHALSVGEEGGEGEQGEGGSGTPRTGNDAQR